MTDVLNERRIHSRQRRLRTQVANQSKYDYPQGPLRRTMILCDAHPTQHVKVTDGYHCWCPYLAGLRLVRNGCSDVNVVNKLLEMARLK